VIRTFFSFLFVWTILSANAQNPTTVSVFDMEMVYEGLELYNQRQIPSEGAYNNQPSFISDQLLLLSAERNGQTDILEYDIATKKKRWITDTESSEYSPQKLPGTDAVAAVQLAKNGNQRLYKYTPDGLATKLIDSLSFAYFVPIDSENIIGTILQNKYMDLVKVDSNSQNSELIITNVGRGIQKIPNSNSVSYTLVNNENIFDVYVVPTTDLDNTYFITKLPVGVQDYVWLTKNQILVGKGNQLFLYDIYGEDKWIPIASLKHFNLKEITRMAVSPSGKRIAIVSE